ncbi:hypothetical protein BOTBODRAFT_140605 [Botryobasidium botryosum FD-172 SS1]|uniref:Uncharacterized protein n=1 Tax=Botryobasidium botryosum (strain FD-172 SS1) TaxID=930990 RepID=A0A067M5T7_BOTB1|nr:hypothetical protein BOTBODRAFT_140605 [Botryobasidium botryosum FD-172 SS1]
MHVESLLSITGIFALVLVLLRLYKFFQLAFSAGNLPRYLHNGSYAFVTGSTDGIGKELAFGLAERGFNVILHGRSPTKLEAVKKELQARFPDTKLETVLADARTADPAEVADRIAHLPVSVLINNAAVGLFGGEPRFLNMASQEQVEMMMSTNVTFPTLLMRAMIPRLVQPALIVNTSSLASEFSPCKLVFYGSTKVFLNTITAGVRRELARQGIDITVQTLQVGVVTTASSVAITHARPGRLTPSPSDFARSVLDRIGGKQALVMGWPWHVLLYIAAASLPTWALEGRYSGKDDKSEDVAGQAKAKAH